MAEQSTRDEMSAAIRGARERHAVPRSIAPEPPPQPVAPPPTREPEPEPAKPGIFARLFGRK